MQLAAQNNFVVYQMDFKTTYFNDKIDYKVDGTQPKEKM